MNKLNIKLAVLFLLILFSVMAINHALSSADVKKLNTAYADVELSNIQDDLHLWLYVTTEFSKKNDVDALKKKISMSLLRKAIMVKTLDPDIEMLGGNALTTLCLLVQPENRVILHSTGNSYASSVAKATENYLIGMEAAVKERITKLKGSGCYLTHN